MSDDGLNMSRRKVLGGITTVGAASAAAGAGTFAAFSDTSSTNEATISTGTVSFQDGNPTTLDLNVSNGGSSGNISGSTKFTYTGSIDATFILGMTVDDVDGDDASFADQIELTKARIVGDQNGEGNITTEDDFRDDDPLSAQPVQNQLYIDSQNYQNNPTLADLNEELSGNETITVNGTDVPATRYFSPIRNDGTITLTVEGGWNDLGNEFQNQEIGVTVYGKVVETSSN